MKMFTVALRLRHHMKISVLKKFGDSTWRWRALNHLFDLWKQILELDLSIISLRRERVGTYSYQFSPTTSSFQSNTDWEEGVSPWAGGAREKFSHLISEPQLSWPTMKVKSFILEWPEHRKRPTRKYTRLWRSKSSSSAWFPVSGSICSDRKINLSLIHISEPTRPY